IIQDSFLPDNEIEEEPKDVEKPADTDADIEIKDVPIDKWRLYKNEERDFSILYHRDWYYTINHKDAREQGYELIIGFAASSSIWDMSRPYPIELIIASGGKELDQELEFSKVIYHTEDVDYILATTNEQLYLLLIDQMAKTFEYRDN
ncbi:hypothetical protein ACFLZ9_02080, partial [Patescibacteria group bacterium]